MIYTESILVLLVELGKKYDQDAVLYKDPSGTVRLYFMNGNSEVYVLEGSGLKTDKNSDLYSKTRGLSFEFSFSGTPNSKWNNEPLTTNALMDQVT